MKKAAQMVEPSDNYQAYLEADLSKARPGEYVVFVDGKLLGKGYNLERLVKRAGKQYPGEVPMIAKMPLTKNMSLLGLVY